MTMLSWVILASMVSPSSPLVRNDVRFGPDQALVLDFNDGYHQFGLHGFLQPSWQMSQVEGEGLEQMWNARRSQLGMSGSFHQGQTGFVFLVDFSLAEPLLDAWVGYRIFDNVSLGFGQKQTCTNNREMLVREDRLALPERSILSRSFSSHGREFGLFLDARWAIGEMVVVPQVAITSGDGRNSFGVDSRDVDHGALKWGGRLDWYIWGGSSSGPSSAIGARPDDSLQVLIGVAGSYNDGASHQTGEGHGDFFIYDTFGEPQLPDYIQIYGDLLVKYGGASVLMEYASASATSLQGTFTDTNAANPLYQSQISEFLSLGQGYNVHVGYVTDWGLSFDARFGMLAPAFRQNANSIIMETTAYAAAVGHYFMEGAAKVQATWSHTARLGEAERDGLEVSLQLRF